MRFRRLCVFCGSQSGVNSAYQESAIALGKAMAKQNIGLVFGGGGVGLMGIIADTVLREGGEIYGVIPRSMAEKEAAHTELSQIHLVDNMHERKAQMLSLSDGFIAMPGGLGTLDELIETWLWAQLGAHDKPVGILNVAGYFDPLFRYLDQMVEEEFLAHKFRDLVTIHADPEELLHLLAEFEMPERERWLDLSET